MIELTLKILLISIPILLVIILVIVILRKENANKVSSLIYVIDYTGSIPLIRVGFLKRGYLKGMNKIKVYLPYYGKVVTVTLDNNNYILKNIK